MRCSAEHIGETKNIVFYGGEPLINFSTIESAVKYARKLEESNSFNGKIQFTMFTNCSLVTKSIAKFLSKNNITIIASVDGPRDIHNQMRLFRNQEPTFDQVLKGYMYLKWHRRCSFNMSSCYQCDAISLCGAGCAYDAYNEFGTLWAVDKRACVQSKVFLEWIIWDLFEKVKQRCETHKLFQILIPSNKELHSLYGNISVDTMTRPLEEYHSRAHIHLQTER